MRWHGGLGDEQTVTGCLKRAAELGVIEPLDDRPRAGRDPVITAEAKTWLVALACQKPKELGYPHELWATRLLAAHARQHAPLVGHPEPWQAGQGTVCKIWLSHKSSRTKACPRESGGALLPGEARSRVRAQDGRNPLCLPAGGDAAWASAKWGEPGPGWRRWRGSRHCLLRRETRDPGDRYDGAGSATPSRHKPDRDARSRIQAARHSDPDGGYRSVHRSRRSNLEKRSQEGGLDSQPRPGSTATSPAKSARKTATRTTGINPASSC